MQESVTEFLEPRVVRVKSKTDTLARIIIEPFERGF
jgi:DNA-directed RNA polymerase alpha subunit